MYISCRCAYTPVGIEKDRPPLLHGRRGEGGRPGGPAAQGDGGWRQKDQKVIVRGNHERVTAFCLKSVTKRSGFFNLERNRRTNGAGGTERETEGERGRQRKGEREQEGRGWGITKIFIVSAHGRNFRWRPSRKNRTDPRQVSKVDDDK